MATDNFCSTEMQNGGMMEDVDCLLCGGQRRRVKYRGSDRLTHAPGEFTLVECLDCGFLYLSPRPDQDEIGRYYSEEYAWSAANEESSTMMRQARQKEDERIVQVVLKHASRGSLLDVGCGVGDFLAAVRAHPGWELHGLEPSPTMAQTAIQTNGLAIEQCRLEDAPYPPGSFDVVTLWEVLEHLPQPRVALQHIHALLKPGGTLLFSVPDRDSFEAKLFGADWVGLDVPRHFSVFSKRHISQALTEAGFDQLDIFTLSGPLGSTYRGLPSLMLSFSIWAQGGGVFGRFRRGMLSVLRPVAQKPAGIIALFFLSLPFQQLSRIRNRGSSMMVTARRP